MKLLLQNLLRDESGQDLIEYALVAALIALGAIAAMKQAAQDPETSAKANAWLKTAGTK